MAEDLSNQKFGRLLVMRDSGLRKGRAVRWLCLCDCGNNTKQTGWNLKNSIVVSCGCYHKEITSEKNIRNLVGQVWGRLTVIKDSGERRARGVKWLCRCECGKEVKIESNSLITGRTSSCGCLRVDRNREMFTTHGRSYSPTFISWRSMKHRCLDESNISYEYYGGRGITVCDRWRYSFENFLEDMGERPVGLSIDRIDNDGNYEPGNCRWATRTEQVKNRGRKQVKQKRVFVS